MRKSGCASAAGDPQALVEVAARVLSDDELGADWSPMPTSTCGTQLVRRRRAHLDLYSRLVRERV